MNEVIDTNNIPEIPLKTEAIQDPIIPDMQKGTFHTEFGCFMFCAGLSFLVGGCSILVIGIILLETPMLFSEISVVMIICGILFVICSIILGSLNILNTIIVDPSAGILKIKKYSLLICCWRTFQFNLKDIKKIYTVYNKDINYIVNNVSIPVFDLLVELTNGERKTVL